MNQRPSIAHPVLVQEQFDRIRGIVYSRIGIHFPDARKDLLASRLARRLLALELNDFAQYADYLTFAPGREAEIEEMLASVTINQTSFFREPEHLASLQSALPALIDSRRRERTLRVWSAACSTGEEAFTVAVMLHRALAERLPDWRIEILGTDVSQKAIAQAQQAMYTDDAVRSMDPTLRDRYLRRDGPLWTPDPLLRSMVGFERHNLKDRLAAKRFGMFDIILCRNALIYFDRTMQQGVVAALVDQLLPGGLLLVGAAEQSAACDCGLQPVSPTCPVMLTHVDLGRASKAA